MSSTKAVIVAVLPKITGCLSILGSSFNLCDILTDHKKRKATYPRLVAVMAALDICLSFAYFLSTWPIPSESGVLWASGTTGTCAAQGFMLQLGLAVPMYNLCLTIYCSMVINLKWSIRKIQKYELGMHAAVLSLALGMALAGFPLTLYNNANLWCWIASHPMDCHMGLSRNGGNPAVECIRGKYAWVFRWAFFYGPLWLIIILVTLYMSFIAYGAYKDQKATRELLRERAERRGDKDSTNNSDDGGGCQHHHDRVDHLSRLTNNVLWQCFYYVLVFYLTWTCPTILRALQTAGRPVPYAIVALMSALNPMQGFFNAMVFMRPRFLRYQKRYPNQWWGATVVKAISKTLARLRPNNSPRERTNFVLSANATCVHDGDDEDENSGGQVAPAEVAKETNAQEDHTPSSSVAARSERPRFWRKRSRRNKKLEYDDDDDGNNSSDEEDDEQIAIWRNVVAKALLSEDEGEDPEVIEIRQSVISAMSAAIGPTTSLSSSTRTATSAFGEPSLSGSTIRDGGSSLREIPESSTNERGDNRPRQAKETKRAQRSRDDSPLIPPKAQQRPDDATSGAMIHKKKNGDVRASPPQPQNRYLLG